MLIFDLIVYKVVIWVNKIVWYHWPTIYKIRNKKSYIG